MIDGKYRILETLGVGGMGAVLAGEHVQLEQPVAIKFLLPQVASMPGALDRFLREARAAARIRGNHAVRILDVTRSESGLPYIVMERLVGMDLAAVLSERGPLPFSEAVGYVLEAMVAVAEAHAAGIVHRDLKPSNLFLATGSDGSRLVKVLDFGVSKTLAVEGKPAVSLTGANALVGSPQYMAPEQVRDGRGVDARVDLWALGVILYELLTDALPFESTSVPHLFVVIMTEPPRPVRDRRPDLPDGLAAIIQRCLEKEPSARFRDVAELAAALAPFALEASPRSSAGAPDPGAGEALHGAPAVSIRAPASPRSTNVNSRADTIPHAAIEPAPAQTRLRWRALAPLGAGVAALAITGALVAAGLRKEPQPPERAEASQSAVAAPEIVPGSAIAVTPTLASTELPAPPAPPPSAKLLRPPGIAGPASRLAVPGPRALQAPSVGPRVRDLNGIKPIE